MQRGIVAFSFSAFAGVAVLVACATSGSPTPESGGDASADAPVVAPDSRQPEAGKDGGGSTSDGASDAPAEASLGECGDKTSRNECSNCCVDKHTDGAAAYLIAVTDCMCVKERCKDACAATLCSPDLKDPDAACNNCLSVKNSECSSQVASQCTADVECAAFDNCMGQSGCLKKL